MNKNVGIIGLGLIGGSLAKAFKKNTTHTVYGFDIGEDIMDNAIKQNAIDYKLADDMVGKCDIIIIALYPHDVISYVQNNISRFKKGSVIIDCAGTKENICKSLSPMCVEQGIYFIGGHPMAGKETSGFSSSTADLYNGASMILCKDLNTNTVALKQAELLFLAIGFGRVTIADAAEHDRVIAFTSQLAHIVSSAYIKSETAKQNSGFSAGSFKDLTRVAKLNETMWTELFFENKENLLNEVDGIINRLTEYKEVLQNDNQALMKELLYAGKIAKEATEGEQT